MKNKRIKQSENQVTNAVIELLEYNKWKIVRGEYKKRVWSKLHYGGFILSSSASII